MKRADQLTDQEKTDIINRVQRILWHNGDTWERYRVVEYADALRGIGDVMEEYDLAAPEPCQCLGCDALDLDGSDEAWAMRAADSVGVVERFQLCDAEATCAAGTRKLCADCYEAWQARQRE